MDQDFLKMGRNALSVGAWEEARDHLEHCVQVKASAEALEELAWAYWWLNDMQQVFDLRIKSHHAYHGKNDKRGASRTASWLGLDYLEFNGEYAIANGWFQRAENLLEGVEGCKELCLIKTLKSNLAFRVDKNIPVALSILNETIELSKSISDLEGLMLAEALKGFILVTEGNVREGMQLLDEATVLALSEESGDIHRITTTCCFLIDACQRIRDYERAGQWCNKVKEICKRWRHKAVFATCRTQYASVLICRGEWQQAETELIAAIKELKEFRPVSVKAGVVRLADLRRRQGKWNEASKLLEQVMSHWTKGLACAELAFDQGEFQQAYHMVDKFLRQVPSNEKTERVAGLELLIRTNVKLNQLQEAEQNLNELEEITLTIATTPLKAAYLNAKGICSFAKGDYNQSRKNLEDVVDQYEQLLSPFEASRARVALAETLEKLNQISAAELELNEAIRMFKTLGAKRDLEKSRQKLKEVGTSANSEFGLTKREIAVLKLVAAGKNNEQISDALSLSVRTIEKHLSNVYEKLGVSGKSARAYAASFASHKLNMH
jgi:ATP/maltotriose-dependent transcriptional regulator MalT